jgi:hypothetical protein
MGRTGVHLAKQNGAHFGIASGVDMLNPLTMSTNSFFEAARSKISLYVKYAAGLGTTGV